MTAKQIEKEVQRQTTLFEERCLKGQVLDKNIRFAEFAEIWMKDRKNDLRPRTYARYESLLPRINAAIGHIKLCKIQPPHLRAFYANLAENGVRLDTVNHAILIGMLREQIKDERVVRLIHRFLKSGVLEHGLVSPTREGTPQGGNLSPLLSNIYLTAFDRMLESRGHKFVRYADDCNKRLCNIKQESPDNDEQLTYFDYDFSYRAIQKRKKITLKYLKQAKTELSQGMTTDEFQKRFAATNGLIMRGGYNEIDNNHYITTAAAIWILDQLSLQNEIETLYEIIYEFIGTGSCVSDESYYPYVSHPMYDSYLITLAEITENSKV